MVLFLDTFRNIFLRFGGRPKQIPLHSGWETLLYLIDDVVYGRSPTSKNNYFINKVGYKPEWGPY